MVRHRKSPRCLQIMNVNKSIGQSDDATKTLLGEGQNAASDLGLLFAKPCVS